MMELVHNDVIVEIRCRFGGKLLRIEGLDGNKQMVDAVGFVAAHIQFAEIGILQHRPEGVQALLQDLLPVCHKQQTAGLPRMLFAEALVIQCGDHSFAGAGSGDHQVAIIPPNGALGIQSVQNFLLVGIGQNIQCIDPAVVGFAVFFGFQGAGQPLLLPFIVIFKLAGIPVAFKSGCDLFDGLRQVLSGHLDVPFQTAGNCRIGQVGGAYIRRSKTGVPVKHIGLCVQAGTFGVVTDLDFCIGQRAQLLDGFHVRSAHIRGGDDAQFATALCKLPQFVHDEAQAAPLDKGDQHINAVGGNDLLFQLRVHLRLMDSAGKQGTLRNGGLRAVKVLCAFSCSKARVILLQKRKKLLCPPVNTERGKVSFLCSSLDGIYDLVCQLDLRLDAAAVILYVLKTLLHHIGQILRQHFGSLRRVDGRSGLAGFRDLCKLAVQRVVDDLFIQSGVEHRCTSLPFSFIIAPVRRIFNDRGYEICFAILYHLDQGDDSHDVSLAQFATTMHPFSRYSANFSSS